MFSRIATNRRPKSVLHPQGQQLLLPFALDLAAGAARPPAPACAACYGARACSLLAIPLGQARSFIGSARRSWSALATVRAVAGEQCATA